MPQWASVKAWTKFAGAILAFGFFANAANAQTNAKPARPRPKPKATGSPARVKVAEGKYELKRIDGASVQSFEEPWTLFKTNVGYELEDQWIIHKDPAGPPAIVDVGVSFAPGLYPIQVKIGGGQAKELRCNMAINEFSCESSGSQSKLPIQGAYNLFLPSPWMLSSIGRRAKKVPEQITKVQLVQMAGMSEAGPKLNSFVAEVQYVGDDQVTVAGEKIPADIYELKAAPVVPSMLMWLSPDGIVLALQDSAKPEQRMELVSFTKFSKF